MPTTVPTPASDADAHESYLRSLGLPLMIAPSRRLLRTPRRAAGVCVGLTVALTGVAALDRANDLVVMFTPHGSDSAVSIPDDTAGTIGLLLLTALALVVISPLLGWLTTRGIRRVGPVTGTLAGAAAVTLLVALPPASFSPQDGPSVRTTLLVAVGVLVGTYAGAGTLLRWSSRRVLRELGTMGPMVARVLPVLMLAVLFLFFSAELWQVMVELSWARTAALCGTLGVLTVLLVVVTTRDDLRRELESTPLDDDGLRVAERVNLLLVPVLATLIQAVLFAALVSCFFLFLGWIAIPEATEARWTFQPTGSTPGLLAGLPVSTTLIRVSVTLGAFSALNLAAAAASDAAHRARFVQPILDDVVLGLAARQTYRRVLIGRSAA